MIDDLAELLRELPPEASRQVYLHAIIEEKDEQGRVIPHLTNAVKHRARAKTKASAGA